MYLSIIYSTVRGLVAFILLMIVTRLMGRKAISQMTFFDFVVAITLGSLTANLGMGSNNNATTAATVIITLAVLAIITDYLHTKSFFVRKVVNSEPVVLIQNGEIVKDNMQRCRVSINDLTTMLREKNTFNIADVEFAIMENDGKLTVQPKSQKQPLTPSDMNIPTAYKELTKDIVIDGNIMYENLKDANLNEVWLIDQLKNAGINNVKDVFFAALDTSGNLYISKGIVGREKDGKYGID